MLLLAGEGLGHETYHTGSGEEVEFPFSMAYMKHKRLSVFSDESSHNF